MVEQMVKDATKVLEDVADEMYMPELDKSEVLKRVWAASAVGMLCTSWEALRCSIDELCAHLNMYDLEVWSILQEQDTCVASVKELEEVLAAEELTDEEVEIGKEKVWYDAKRVMTVRQEVVEDDKDGGEGEGESKLDEEDDEPIRGPGLSAKVQGKRPAK